MWVQGTSPSGGTAPPSAAQFSLPAQNWVMECWILPVGSGRAGNGNDSEFMNTGTGQFGATPGGAALRLTRTFDENGDNVITVRADAIGPLPENNFTIGTPVVVSQARWTHVAVVNAGGVTTYYVNGVPSGDSSSLVTAPSGTPYIGSGQDTGRSYRGYLDEMRYSTFAPGAFRVADLLLLPPGPGFISRPQSATVWDGGAAPFESLTVRDPDKTFQWKLNDVNIPGATDPDYIVPSVTAGDSGKAFKLTVTNASSTSTTDAATLTVTPKQTANNTFYRAAITAESSLVAYFPVDGSTTSTVTNVTDGTHSASLQGTAYYDGRTTRSYGERAVRFRSTGYATVPANPAFEFTDGSGTIEALVYLDPPSKSTNKTIFALTDGVANYYALQVSSDGNTVTYKNDSGVVASWAVTPTLVGRLAHVAVAFTPGKVTAYVDGVSLGQKDNAQFGTTPGLSAYIGSLGVDGTDVPIEAWTGSIDELAIYGDALSENTIAVHNSRFIYGTAVTAPTISSSPSGTWNLLSGGAPIYRVAAAGTAPLAYTWKRNGVPVTGNSTADKATFTLLNSTAASSGTYTVTVSNPIGAVTSDPFTVNFTDPSPADKYAGFVLADGPTGYWRLDELTGPVLKDYAGGFDGTYNEGRVNRGQDGPYGIDPNKATKFNANGLAASIPYTPILNPAGAYSLEFWAKPAQSGNASRAVLGTQNRNVGRTGYAIYQGFNGSFWEAHLGYNGSVIFLQGKTAPVAGRWDHVVVTWNGGLGGSNVSKLYVNGVEEASSNLGPTQNNTAMPLEIGSRFNGSVPYNGTVDEVAFYNYALTPVQVEKHFSIAYYASSITTNPTPVPNGPEAGTITLTAVATGFPNTYQWTVGGVALDPAALNADGSQKYPGGVTSQTLKISQALPSDNGLYQLNVTNGLGNSSTTPVQVTVPLDTTPPVTTYVTASSTLNRVRVAFNKPVSDSVLAPANYTFTGGLTATEITRTTDPAVIDITTTGMTPGGSYSLSMSGIRDTRTNQNLIGANNAAFGGFVYTPGILTWDYYRGIPGSNLGLLQADAQYPNGVWTTRFLPGFSTASVTLSNDLNNNPAFTGGLGDNYGAHVYGWITPTVTGNYNFFLRSDDASELFLSTDASPANAVQIAFESGCCDPFKEPAPANTETSVGVPLVAGQSYYVEAFQKEGGGGDYVEVAWRLEGVTVPTAGNLKPIPASFLATYAPAAVTPGLPGFGGLNAPVINGNQVTLSWTGSGFLQSSPDLTTWTDVAGLPASPAVLTQSSNTRLYYRLRQ